MGSTLQIAMNASSRVQAKRAAKCLALEPKWPSMTDHMKHAHTWVFYTATNVNEGTARGMIQSSVDYGLPFGSSPFGQVHLGGPPCTPLGCPVEVTELPADDAYPRDDHLLLP
eukprot:2154937-Amphidinium_carterae.1